MVFVTERLYLRPWREDDAEDLFLYASEPEVGLPSGWQPHTDADNSREVILNVLSTKETYAVCLKADGKPIGSISLMFRAREGKPFPEGECELGFWIGKPFWGQSLIPEAAVTLLRHAFDDLLMKQVWCAYYDGNEKSKRAQEKLGFVFHHTNLDEPVPMLNTVRTAHYMLMTKQRWEELKDDALYLRYYNGRKAEMKTAVVYYSLSGNTAMVADKVAAQLGADTLALAPQKAYPASGFKMFFYGGRSAVTGEAPALAPYTFDADAYERIIFGTPVWASTFAPPLRTFINDNQEALENKRLAVFTCQGGNGAEKAIKKLKKELGREAFDAELILIEPKENENDENEAKINAFCVALK